MKIKRCIASVTAAAFCATMITGTASAHNEDILQGKYIGQNGANLVFWIDFSARLSLPKYESVYTYGMDWNGISSNVNVTVLEYTAYPPGNGEMYVMGEVFDDSTLGQTVGYRSNGTISGKNNDWAYVTITMNSDDRIFKYATHPTTAAKKTFIHEVGHALKLDHPKNDRSLMGHVYTDGRPYAIMNQGLPFPDDSLVPSEIASHDRDNLIAKWGA